jgi:hypothetical protein
VSIVYKPSSKEVTIQAIAVSIEYPTNITILEYPTTVYVGEAFGIRFRLTYVVPGRGEYPLGGVFVKVYVNDQYRLSVLTASDGTGTASMVLDAPGTYKIKLVFEGASA